MDILLIGNSHFKKSLEQLGHKVISKAGDRAERLDVTRFDANLIIVHESLGMREISHGIERARVPTVFYSVDVHLNLYWHKEYAKLFDYVFVTQKDYVSRFKQENVFWLPWSIDPSIFRDENLDRVYDITFIGTIDHQRIKRRNIINGLKKRFQVEVFGTDPEKRLSKEEMAKVYSSSKIILNESIYGEITFRTFEALACGGMLLTEKIENGLCDLFKDSEEIVTYDYHNFIEKTGYYLNNPLKRQQIACRGKQKVLQNHTIQKSATNLMDILEKQHFRKRNISREKLLLHYGKTLYFTGIKFPKYQKRRLQRAALVLKRTQDLFQGDWEPIFYMALVYIASKEFRRAMDILRPYFNHATDNLNLLMSNLFAHLLWASGDQETAFKYFKAISQDKTITYYNYILKLGKIYEENGWHCEIGAINPSGIPMNAMECYNQTNSLEGMICGGNLSYRLKLFNEASKFFIAAKKTAPQDRSISYKLGLSYLHLYEIEAAIDELKKQLF